MKSAQAATSLVGGFSAWPFTNGADWFRFGSTLIPLLSGPETSESTPDQSQAPPVGVQSPAFCWMLAQSKGMRTKPTLPEFISERSLEFSGIVFVALP